jgi:hypothetical protein
VRNTRIKKALFSLSPPVFNGFHKNKNKAPLCPKIKARVKRRELSELKRKGPSPTAFATFKLCGWLDRG